MIRCDLPRSRWVQHPWVVEAGLLGTRRPQPRVAYILSRPRSESVKGRPLAAGDPGVRYDRLTWRSDAEPHGITKTTRSTTLWRSRCGSGRGRVGAGRRPCQLVLPTRDRP